MTNLKTLANTRVDRPTFWIIFAVVLLASFVVRVVVDSAGLSPARWAVPLALVWVIWSLVCAARAHDMGRSGWFGLLVLLPLVGLCVVLWLGFSRRWEDALAAEVAANNKVIAALEGGPCWMSLIEIAERAGGDWELTILRVRQLDAQGTLTNNGLQGRERRYRIG